MRCAVIALTSQSETLCNLSPNEPAALIQSLDNSYDCQCAKINNAAVFLRKTSFIPEPQALTDVLVSGQPVLTKMFNIHFFIFEEKNL